MHQKPLDDRRTNGLICDCCHSARDRGRDERRSVSANAGLQKGSIAVPRQHMEGRMHLVVNKLLIRLVFRQSSEELDDVRVLQSRVSYKTRR